MKKSNGPLQSGRPLRRLRVIGQRWRSYYVLRYYYVIISLFQDAIVNLMLSGGYYSWVWSVWRSNLDLKCRVFYYRHVTWGHVMVKGLMSYCLSHQYYKMVTLKSCYDYVVEDYQKYVYYEFPGNLDSKCFLMTDVFRNTYFNITDFKKLFPKNISGSILK